MPVSAGFTGGIPRGILRDMAAESKKRNKKRAMGGWTDPTDVTPLHRID
jgi:hypothetical protein